ncbi:flippase [Methanobrevibacter sp. DSM 116169]|uniref:flippase n=1 Tax=Methanobrevibacter sp. DSM 116169 TaxID=3242727 RepID=UPI0038FD2CA2
MSQVRTSFLNMSWLMVSQIITSICAFIWTILIARYLGVNDYGILGFAISITGIFAITVDMGISTHIVRKISINQNIASKYLGNAIPLKSFFSLITFFILLLILIFLKFDELTIIVTLLFTIEMFFKSMAGLFNGSFQAVEEGKYQAIGNIILNIILLIFILISIFCNFGLIGIALAYLFSNFIVMIYLYIKIKTNVTIPEYELDKDFCIKLTKVSLPFAFYTLFHTIYYSIDITMLTILVGEYASGLYNASYKLINVLTLFYTIYTAVIFPVMSKFYKNNESLLNITFEKSMKYLLAITVPIAVVTSIYAKDLILLVYGSQYILASSVLSILIWTVCLLFINGAASILLNASYKEVAVTKIYAIAAIFNVIANLILIPMYQANGAAVATVLSDILIFILAFYVLRKTGYAPRKSLLKDLFKIILGSIILGLVLYFLNLSLFVGLIIGVIIYLIALLLLKIIDDDDMYIIKEILGKN